jgi:hypothetical protein
VGHEVNTTIARANVMILASAIARALFTNGQGEVADRLILTVDGPRPRDLGGWSEAAAIDQIVRVLSAPARG